jgi:prepilin-type N-terminal cleavage/methylation domain-containing protein
MEFVIRKRILRRQEGFSLIEVMIATVLFAIGLIAFAGLEVLAVRNSTYSKDYGKANTYAQQKVEELKGTAWASVSAGSDRLEEKFTRTWTVREKETDIMKEIAVSVAWVDPSYGTKRISLQTDLYSNPAMP